MNARFLLLIPIVAPLAFGCSKPEPKNPEQLIPKKPYEAPAMVAEDKLHDALSAGGYQLSAAVETLNEALAAVEAESHAHGGTTHQGLREAADFLDGAGTVAAEYAGSPPSRSELEVYRDKYEKRLQAAIAAVQDALTDVESATGILESLAAEAAPNRQAPLGKLAELSRAAEEDLKGALDGFRGSP